MARIQAPNGLILDVPDAIASGLVASRNHPGFVYLDDSAGPPAAPIAPKPYASKAEWVAHAVESGMSQDEAESLSKNDLIALIG